MLHELSYAEFVPAAPLLPALAELLAFAVAFGLCVVAVYFVRALFGTAGSAVGWIPWIGSKAKGQLHSIEAKLTGELGGVVDGLDHRVAASWYKLARTAKWMAEEIAANAGMLAAFASLLQNPIGIPAWKQLWDSLHGTVKTLPAVAAGKVSAGLRPITARVSALEHWTHARVRALAHTIEVAIPGDIAGLRRRSRTVEDSLSRAWEKIRANEGRFAGLAFAGAVAVALGRLGVGWIRCTKVGRLGRTACGMDDSLLESLLAGTLLIVGTISIVELAKELQAITPEVVDGVRAVIREA
jgi:hypothetical protein